LKKITDESGRTIERWSYNQGVPERVEKANGIIIDIRTLGNDLLYYECVHFDILFNYANEGRFVR